MRVDVIGGAVSCTGLVLAALAQRLEPRAVIATIKRGMPPPPLGPYDGGQAD
ncbi:MAG: hypothetical protein WA864_23320 [Acetobacteraceae bacterium]